MLVGAIWSYILNTPADAVVAGVVPAGTAVLGWTVLAYHPDDALLGQHAHLGLVEFEPVLLLVHEVHAILDGFEVAGLVDLHEYGGLQPPVLYDGDESILIAIVVLLWVFFLVLLVLWLFFLVVLQL